MKLLDIINVRENMKKTNNKYDVAIQMCYLIFYSIGVIVFFSLGLQYMTLSVWLLLFVCCALGATAYGTVAKIIITLIRKDLQDGKKEKAETVQKLLYLVILSIVTIVFVATGLEYGTVKYWLISFVGSYGGAVIACALVRMITTLARKDN